MVAVVVIFSFLFSCSFVCCLILSKIEPKGNRDNETTERERGKVDVMLFLCCVSIATEALEEEERTENEDPGHQHLFFQLVFLNISSS